MNTPLSIGSTITSHNHGTAEIIAIKGQRLTICFTNTGNIKEIHRVAAYNGSFSDTEEKERKRLEVLAEAHEKRVKRRMTPSVRGVGYLGMGEFKATSPFYRVWADMLRRCYDPKFHLKYPTYAGCTVCERWHNFQHFCEDFPLIDNYHLWEEQGADLDKDCKVYGNKHYSLETCKFLSHEDNIRDAMFRKGYDDVNLKAWEGMEELRQYALAAQERSQQW